MQMSIKQLSDIWPKSSLESHSFHKIFLISDICTTCSSASDKTCFNHNGACFYRQCGKYNWYEARHGCHQKNMHLAVSVMDSDEGLQSWLMERCKRVWLGYSKEDWYYLNPLEGNMFILHFKLV